jgi:Mrp family chromosome partitioning ATPase
MSRIADALQRARTENPASTYAFDPAAPTPRQLAQVQIPWILGEMSNASVAPPPLGISQAPSEPQKLREVPTPATKEPVSRAPRGEEAIAALIRNLFQVRAGVNRGVRRLLFTSVDDKFGPTDIAIRVAEALATQSNRSVCLADLDLHNPTLHRRFPVEGQRGFSDAVVERGPLRACTHGAPSHSNLWLLPAGLPTLDVIPRLGEADIQRRLGDLLATFYYVIAYTAPVGLHVDATQFGAIFDGVILVADANVTKAAVVRTAAQTLEHGNVRLLGTLLNHRV